jgi:hypothetical protein
MVKPRKMTRYVLPVAGILMAALPAVAHHSIAAAFDEKKPVTVKGMVTKYEFTNPHVYVYIDAQDKGQTTKWAAEFESALDQMRVGWSADSVKSGDAVTIEGIAARDGSKTISGKSITLPGGKKLAMAPPDIKLAPKNPSKKDAPKWPNGHVRLGVEPGARGFWADPSVGSLYEASAGNIRMSRDGQLANIADSAKVAPFQPWAKGLYEYRQKNMLRDDPMAFCLPPGGPRQFEDRYGIQIVEQPERNRIFVMSGGGNRNWRLIYLDGRTNPDPEEVTPTYYGYSTGKWAGDTLTVETTAFAERFWFSNGGLPHTENLRLTEKFTRPDFNTLRYEVTVNDPGAYTRPWTGGWSLSWVPDADIQEYFCDDNNKETEHLSGKHN